MAEDAVNWEEYFFNIKTVCPWSWAAWQRQQIHITKWHSHILDLGSYQARLYIAPRHNPRQLKKMCDRFNSQRTHEEWLWSHPVFEHNSTPVSVFIQQDKLLLERARMNQELLRKSAKQPQSNRY